MNFSRKRIYRTCIAVIIQSHLLDKSESKTFVNSHIRRKLTTFKIATESILICLKIRNSAIDRGPSGKYVEREHRQYLSPDYPDDLPEYSKTNIPSHQSRPASASPPVAVSTTNTSTIKKPPSDETYIDPQSSSPINQIHPNLLNPQPPTLSPFPPTLFLLQRFRRNPHCYPGASPFGGMRHQDISIGNSPTQADSETNCIASQGQRFLVVDEEIERIVYESGLDCLDCVRDVFGCYKRDFNGHFGNGDGIVLSGIDSLDGMESETDKL